MIYYKVILLHQVVLLTVLILQFDFVFQDTEVRARTVKSGKVAVLLVTSGLEEKLTGTLVYCVKADANKELKMRNIADVSTLLELVNKFFFCSSV